MREKLVREKLERNFVWECDYGVRKPLKPALMTMLDEQNASQLQMIQIFVDENPYNLELYIVLSYDNPIEGQINRMMDLMTSVGVRYRPDITHEELMSEIGGRRFNSMTLINSQLFDFQFNSLFNYVEREDAAKKVSMRPLGKKMPVFLSHTSINKPEVEDLIPYLNGANLPVWYGKINIDYGESIVKKIQEGIKEAGAVIFWITREFLKSNWCNTEVETFLTRLAGKDDILIISVVFDDIVEDDIPFFLTNKKYLRVGRDDSLANIAQEIIPSIKRYYDVKRELIKTPRHP